MEFRTAGVIGAGAWGTALAQVCVRAGLDTTLQAREPQLVETLATTRANDLYLPGVTLAEDLKFTADLADLRDCDLILAVPPAQHMRATLTAFAPHHRAGVPVVELFESIAILCATTMLPLALLGVMAVLRQGEPAAEDGETSDMVADRAAGEG